MAEFNTINPSNNVNIKSVDFVSIDVSGYMGKSVYGEVGEKATGKSSSLTSKLNHRTEYDPDNKLGTGASAKHPYVYIKEGNKTGNDADTYGLITKLSNGNGVDKARNISIGAYNGTSRGLNGDTNRDTIHKGSIEQNNEFMYNAGNIENYQTDVYDDSDLATGGVPTVVRNNAGKLEKKVSDDKWEELKIDGEGDPRNTSNTMNKTMNAYSVTVKPMDARNL